MLFPYVNCHYRISDEFRKFLLSRMFFSKICDMRTLKPIENGSLFYNTPINNAVFHVPASGSSSAKAVRMSFDDDAITEILLLEGENTEETVTSPVYDLNGMQKSGISKGWNIVNGKKILIKLHSTLALPTAPNLSNSETNVFFASNENNS